MNCSKCGYLLRSNAKFCKNCGEPVIISPVPNTDFAPAQPAWLQKTEAQEPVKSAENPSRAVWLAAAALMIMIFTSFFSEWYINHTACVLLFYFSAGCALYLFTRNGLRYKICAGGILLLASFLTAYISEISRVLQATRRYIPSGAFNSFFVTRIVFYLIFSAILCVIGVIFSLAVKKENNKTKILCSGLISAGALVVYVFFKGEAYTLYRGILSYTLRVVLLGNVIPAVINSAVLFLSLIAVNMFCNLRSRKIQTGAGHKIWFSLCFASSTIVLISQNIIEMAGSGGAPLIANNFIFFVLTSIGIIGYIQLLASKRSGYPIILTAIGFIFFINFKINVSSFLMPLLQRGQLYTPALGDTALSFMSLINPFITGMTLISVWKIIPNEPPLEKRVPVVFKIFSVIGLLTSLAMFFTGSLVIYGIYEFSARNVGIFVTFVVIGAALAVLQFFCAASCFGRNSKGSKGLLITGLVFAVVSTIMLTGSLIGIVSSFS